METVKNSQVINETIERSTNLIKNAEHNFIQFG